MQQIVRLVSHSTRANQDLLLSYSLAAGIVWGRIIDLPECVEPNYASPLSQCDLPSAQIFAVMGNQIGSRKRHNLALRIQEDQ